MNNDDGDEDNEDVEDTTASDQTARNTCESLIGRVEAALNECSKATQIEGMRRLERRLTAELNFLTNLMQTTDTISLSRVHSSNYAHLCSLAELVTKKLTDVVAVLKSFKLPNDKVTVDIVTKNSWIKVIARNAQSVHMIWAGVGREGQRSAVDSIQSYFNAAERFRSSFEQEGFSIRANFVNGVTDAVAKAIRRIGAIVEGDIVELDEKTRGFCFEMISDQNVDDDDDVGDDSHEIVELVNDWTIVDEGNTQSIKPLDIDQTAVNLDVTTMTAMISELTNGTEIPIFDSEYHEINAAQERANRLLPEIEAFIGGRQMIACRTAIDLMRSIVERVGGLNEQRRFLDLMKKIKVVDDDPSDRCMKLETSKRVSERSKIIFGTADKLRIVSLTSNWGFVRSAQLQGIVFYTWEHDSFPLRLTRFLNQLKRRRRHELQYIVTRQDV